MYVALAELQNTGCHLVDEITVVRYEQNGSLVAGQHFFQRFFSRQIHVIRRLVQNQEIRFCIENPAELQPHFFTAGELSHFLFDILTGKQKGSQCTSDIVAKQVRIKTPEIVEHRLLRVEFLVDCFVLIEVGKIHAVSKLITSAQWIDFAHNGFQKRRFSFSVFSDDHNPFCFFDDGRNLAQDGIVSDFQFLHREHIRIAFAYRIE